MGELETFAADIADLRSTGDSPERILAKAEDPFRGLLRSELLPPALRSPNRPGAGRYVLHRSDAVTIFAMVSRPGSVSAVHDHGAWGLVGQVSGQEVEHLYTTEDEDLVGDGIRLERVTSHHLKPGDVTTILPPGRDIHQVITVSSEPSVSLHAFAHDLVHRGFTVFAPAVYEPLHYTGHWDNEDRSTGATE